MPGKTNISWATDTWNLAWGCDKVSPGCAHCYIEDTPPFRLADMRFVKGKIPIVLHPDRFEVPLRWKRPRMIFVNSLSDMFHDDIPTEFIAQAYAVMVCAPQHIYQVLTKRPERMRELLSDLDFWNLVGDYVAKLHGPYTFPMTGDHVVIPHIWHGVTVENRHFGYRANVLRETPSRVRFISAEPLLGPLIVPEHDGLTREEFIPWPDYWGGPELWLGDIDWIIIGGESGAKARRFDEAWARDIIQEAREHDTAVHVKQMGSLWARQHGVKGKAEQPAEWPEDLRLREWPAAMEREPESMPSGPSTKPTLF